jgi:hypothetical protein
MAKKRRTQKEGLAYWVEPGDAVRSLGIDPEYAEVSPAELIQMAKNITNGEDKAPQRYIPEQRRQWKILAREIKAIRDRGGIVKIPDAVP